MADFTFRVTPEELERKSSEFSTTIQSISRRLNQIEEIAEKTRGYWQGEAGDKDRSGYASYKDDITFIVKRLQEHPIDLLKMAGIYKQAERTAMEKESKLKTDQIV